MSTPVTVGDKVSVTGTVAELGTAPNTLTELTTVTVQIISSGNALPALVDIAFPVTAVADLERYEGMRVRVPQTLTASEHFRLARFGELLLSANGRLLQPTEVVDPNDDPATGTTSTGSSNVAAVTARANLNLRSSIVLADTSSTQNPAVIPFLDPVNNTLRLGTTVNNLTGILNHSFGTYVIHATEAPNFNYAPRPLTPPAVGGNLKVASFNVLNFFNGNGTGGGFPTSRGADTPYEFGRQKDKIVAAICGLNADVVGLMEMENDGNGATSALTELTTALSAANSCGNWTYVPNPAGWGTIPGSTDEIRPAIIYRTTTVSPVGASMAPNSSAFNQARAPVAQTFSVSSGVSAGAKFSVIVNHFKSKGGTGTGADADQGDGQGNWNAARKGQATALLGFITTVQAAANDPDVIVLGDLNAYSEEDPIDILRAGGLIDLAKGEHSYVFDGQSGSLDHAMVTPSLMAQITNAAIWNINSDEPVILDYNVEFKNNPNCTSTTCNSPDYYQPTPFRSSDHDPVLVGMALGTPALDIDDSSPVTQYDAASDGVLLLRYLFGLRDAAMTDGVISPSARRNAAQIAQHISDSLLRFDVDGDGQTLALTDGLMILRRMLGITGATAVTAGAKNGTRSDADIVLIIDNLKP
jgi:predicted extracellular nuclease